MPVTLKEKLRENSGLALGSTLDKVSFVTSLWRKTPHKRMRTSFQAEALKVYYKGLPWIEKEIPSQYEGWNSRFFLFLLLTSTAARCPWHIQKFDHDLARIGVQCHCHCLICFFGTKGWKPLSTGKQWDMKNFEGSSFILILPAHSDALKSVCVALQLNFCPTINLTARSSGRLPRP